MKYCPKCGKEIIEGGKFCFYCGYSFQSNTVPATRSEITNGDIRSLGGGKIKTSYLISFIITWITFVIRISLQEEFKYWKSVLERAAYIGLDDSIKPGLSFIPLAMVFISTLLIISDKTKSTKTKAIAFVVNAVFVIIAVACIWYNIPTEPTYY